MATKTATKSLLAQGEKLSAAAVQMAKISRFDLPAFNDKLAENSIDELKAGDPEIFQINLGKMCNQVCEHCHVDAGPDRKEIMTRETMEACLEAIDNTPSLKTVDLTGGAPEMNPDFEWLVDELHRRDLEIIVRSNLTILEANEKYKAYPDFFKKMGIRVVASLPCYTKDNVDKQRGDGVFDKSIAAIQKLNALGYGQEGSGLTLDFVFNPGGPSLPGDQMSLEADYKRILGEEFGIKFNSLFTITNMPISRFLSFLLATGKIDLYLEKLLEGFNPGAVSGLMCLNTLSISWDGKIFDCDFNQMLELPVSCGSKTINDYNLEKLTGRKIVVNKHCYGCTAGAGSSCQGTIA